MWSLPISTRICEPSLQYHNYSILFFSNINNNSTIDGKFHLRFAKGHSVFGAGERGTRTVTDLSCLTYTWPLGMKVPSLSWRVPVNVPYLSWRVPVIPYLSWWVPPTGNSHLALDGELVSVFRILETCSCIICTLHYLYTKNFSITSEKTKH